MESGSGEQAIHNGQGRTFNLCLGHDPPPAVRYRSINRQNASTEPRL